MLNIILTNYLTNLKERKELDCIFIPLIQTLGYQILKTPSQGQPEFGKDIVAVHENEGQKTLFVFQLKAGADKDITSRIFTKEDGIRESLLAAKDVRFIDQSYPGLMDLPIKIVLVHTGILSQNCYPQFNGFINSEFNKEGQPSFERWDIYKLSDLFSDNLFNEYLFTNNQCNLELLKKALAIAGNDDRENTYFIELVMNILNSCNKRDQTTLLRLLSTLTLIGNLIFEYSQDSDNLYPAKENVTFMLLQTWGWILENNLENNQVVIENLYLLFMLHFVVLEKYLSKLYPLLNEENGLFYPFAGEFEAIGYPLRCYSYINYLLYYYWCCTELYSTQDNFDKLKNNLETTIKACLKNNIGCMIPLMDNYSITFINILDFYMKTQTKEEAKKYIDEVFNNIALTKSVSKRLPELHNNIDSVIEFVATGERPYDFCDSSSYLIELMFEISLKMGWDDIFDKYWNFLVDDTEHSLKLLVYHPPKDIVDNEHILYQHELKKEGYTSVFQEAFSYDKKDLVSIKANLKSFIERDGFQSFEFRTEKTPFRLLNYLTHIYYLTPHFPYKWREI